MSYASFGQLQQSASSPSQQQQYKPGSFTTSSTQPSATFLDLDYAPGQLLRALDELIASPDGGGCYQGQFEPDQYKCAARLLFNPQSSWRAVVRRYLVAYLINFKGTDVAKALIVRTAKLVEERPVSEPGTTAGAPLVRETRLAVEKALLEELPVLQSQIATGGITTGKGTPGKGDAPPPLLLTPAAQKALAAAAARVPGAISKAAASKLAASVSTSVKKIVEEAQGLVAVQSTVAGIPTKWLVVGGVVVGGVLLLRGRRERATPNPSKRRRGSKRRGG